jgi:hypothetical protein
LRNEKKITVIFPFNVLVATYCRRCTYKQGIELDHNY